MKRRAPDRVLAVLALIALTVLLLTTWSAVVPAGADAAVPAGHRDRSAVRPILFVHGYSGSGNQFETPARRFASNGYPAADIDAVDYDSTFATTTITQVYAAIDAKVSALLARSGATRIDLVGHSLGTAVSQGYLNSSPARAARVAHYVNLDGASATAPPGGVATLAIWAQLNPSGTITGAQNVYETDESHTQSVTSVPSFEAMYRFFTGHPPRTTLILPQLPGQVRLSGRAVLFPANQGVTGATLTVYRVSPATGARLGRPVASYQLSGDGSFGPFRADGLARYEFAISQDGVTHHLYYEPFLRTDRLIRLLTSEPGQGLDALTQTSPTSTNLIVTRNKEWWSDQGANDDTLTANGVSLIDGLAPKSKLVIADFVFDQGEDGVSHPGTPIPALAGIPFLTGVDLHLPAAAIGPGGTPSGVVHLVAQQRSADPWPDVFNLPDWPSATDRVSVQFNDYAQELPPWL